MRAALIICLLACATACGVGAGPSSSASADLATAANTLEDNFSRSDQSGWGTSTNTDGVMNAPWLMAGASSSTTISSDTGRFLYPGSINTVGIASAGCVTYNGGDGLAKVSVSAVGHGTPYIVVNACANKSCYYGARVHTSIGQLELAKRSGGGTNIVASKPVSVSAGVYYWVRVDFNASTKVLSGKIWPDGTAEPTAWSLQWTDNGTPNPAGYAGAGGSWDQTGTGEFFSYRCYAFAAPGTGLATPCGGASSGGSAGGGLAVSSFTLLETSVTNIAAGSPVSGFDPISSGATVSLAQTGSQLSLRANISTTVGSVAFSMDGTYSHTENIFPYTLCGDNGTGTVTNCNFSLGTHTVTATPYSGSNRSGTPGAPLTVTFTVVSSGASDAGSGGGSTGSPDAGSGGGSTGGQDGGSGGGGGGSDGGVGGTADVAHLIRAMNISGYTTGDQFMNDTTLQGLIRQHHIPWLRMPFRDGWTDAQYTQMLNAIKNAGASPLAIVHGACAALESTSDHWLSLVDAVFPGTYYVEYGNEEDLSCNGGGGLSASSYTSGWNRDVPLLKANHQRAKFMGPVNFQYNASYLLYFMQNANPRPDAISWHEYVCSSTDSDSTCLSHIANWGNHFSSANAQMTTAGYSVPIWITEWNMDPNDEARYTNQSFIQQWTSTALSEWSTLANGQNLGVAMVYTMERGDNSSGFQEVYLNDTWTYQGATLINGI